MTEPPDDMERVVSPDDTSGYVVGHVIREDASDVYVQWEGPRGV